MYNEITLLEYTFSSVTLNQFYFIVFTLILRGAVWQTVGQIWDSGCISDWMFASVSGGRHEVATCLDLLISSAGGAAAAEVVTESSWMNRWYQTQSPKIRPFLSFDFGKLIFHLFLCFATFFSTNICMYMIKILKMFLIIIPWDTKHRQCKTMQINSQVNWQVYNSTFLTHKTPEVNRRLPLRTVILIITH